MTGNLLFVNGNTIWPRKIKWIKRIDLGDWKSLIPTDFSSGVMEGEFCQQLSFLLQKMRSTDIVVIAGD